MDQQRSPRYPSVSLPDAITAARALWAKEKRTAVNGEVLAKAVGYKSNSGPARSLVGAMRQYGLLEKHGTGLRLSDVAMHIIHSAAGSKEQLLAISEAALTPELFRDLDSTHSDASEDAIASYLILKKGFSEGGARLAASTYKDTLSLAKPTGQGCPPKREDLEDPVIGTAKVGDLVQWESQGVLQFREPVRVRALSEDGAWAFVEGSETGIPIKELIVEKPGTGAEKPQRMETPLQPPKLPLPSPSAPTQLFSWPLSKDVTAEVRLTGLDITSAHLELLRDYLELAKKAMQGTKQSPA